MKLHYQMRCFPALTEVILSPPVCLSGFVVSWHVSPVMQLGSHTAQLCPGRAKSLVVVKLFVCVKLLVFEPIPGFVCVCVCWLGGNTGNLTLHYIKGCQAEVQQQISKSSSTLFSVVVGLISSYDFTGVGAGSLALLLCGFFWSPTPGRLWFTGGKSHNCVNYHQFLF